MTMAQITWGHLKIGPWEPKTEITLKYTAKQQANDHFNI